MAREQNVERSERSAPGKFFALLKPFGVLGGHRIDHLRECFVRRPHPVATCKQVAFEPSLAEMLAQYFHHAAIWAEFIVDRDNLSHRAAVRSFKNRIQTIGIRFIGAKHPKVCWIHSEDIPKESRICHAG